MNGASAILVVAFGLNRRAPTSGLIKPTPARSVTGALVSQSKPGYGSPPEENGVDDSEHRE
jgi:hypothetical protein